LAPFFTAPGSVCDPILFGPAAVGAPELLVLPAEGEVPLMPVVPMLPLEPFCMEPFSMLFMPGFCILSDCGAGPVLLCAKAALDNNRAADAIKTFLMDISLVRIEIGSSIIPPAMISFLRTGERKRNLKPF
jgi:hypothetical protein